jgi:4-hydroxy-tetrahydrodipicolinate reductase
LDLAPLRIIVAGAGGRMGAALIGAVSREPGMVLAAALERGGSPLIGRDAGELAAIGGNGVVVSSDIDVALAAGDAILDFSSPAGSAALAGKAAKLGLVHVIGTTGCSVAEGQAIRAAGAAGARIVMSGNMSLGVNLLAGLVRKAAEALPGFDVEILEMHHAKKVDAPSGTALLLGEAAARGRNVTLDTHGVMAREGHTGERRAGDIGFAALRGGTVVGDHTVILAGRGERIELTHRAEDRSIFAQGAVRAALWAAGQQPGFYSMADVLGLND